MKIYRFLLAIVPIIVASFTNAGTNHNAQIVAHAVVSFEEIAQASSSISYNPSTPIKTDVVPIGMFEGVNEIPADQLPVSSSETNFEPPKPPTPFGPVTNQTSFEAMPDGPDIYGYMHIPPDTMGVAGPNHLMVVLNSYVRIQNKSGGVISTVTLNDFWASVDGGGGATAGAFDPKIVYDHDEGRFIFVTLDDRDANNGILLGISATDDPTGTWYLWKIDADASNVDWADFPSPGFNSKWIALSMNMFTISANSFTGAKIWMIDKERAYTNDLNIIDVFDNGDFSGGSTIAPCRTFGSEPNLYTVDSSWSSGLDDFVRRGQISGAVNSPAWAVLGYADVPDTYVPGDAPQLGGSDLIDNGDSRISSPPVFRHGRIYFNYCGLLSNNVRHVIVWAEINAAAGTFINSGIVQESTTPMFYAYPSIAVNSKTNIVMGFAGFSAGIYASAYYTGREENDTANTMQMVRSLKAGEDYYYKTFGGSRNRWGDYSATCVDPSDDTKFWSIQEYAMPDVGSGVNDDRWGTWWGQPSFIPEPTGLFLFSLFLGSLIMSRKK